MEKVEWKFAARYESGDKQNGQLKASVDETPNALIEFIKEATGAQTVLLLVKG